MNYKLPEILYLMNMGNISTEELVVATILELIESDILQTTIKKSKYLGIVQDCYFVKKNVFKDLLPHELVILERFEDDDWISLIFFIHKCACFASQRYRNLGKYYHFEKYIENSLIQKGALEIKRKIFFTKKIINTHMVNSLNYDYSIVETNENVDLRKIIKEEMQNAVELTSMRPSVTSGLIYPKYSN